MSKKNVITSLLIIWSFAFVFLGDYQTADAGGPTSCNIGCGNLVPTGGTCGSGAIAMVCEGDPQGTGYCMGDPCNNWNCSLCGSAANGGPYESAPTDNLCGWANFLYSPVVDSGSAWTWQCRENPIGSPVINCSAPKSAPTPAPSDGTCGSADGGSYSSAPNTDLCSSGSASPVSGSGPWNWTCNGSSGGTDASCQAVQMIAAACGTASKTYQSDDTDWPANTTFCATGASVPANPAFPAQGGTVGWTCNGSNDGANITCQASRESATPTPPDSHEKEKEDCSGKIGNYVWLDANGDGKQDPAEKGLSGVHIKLTFGGTTYRTKTDNKGRYSFKNLCKGDYKVTVKDEDVAGYAQTYDPDDTKNNKTDVELKNNHDSHMNADFGYRGRKVAPATGSGNVAIYVSILLTLMTFITYRKIKNRKLALGR